MSKDMILAHTWLEVSKKSMASNAVATDALKSPQTQPNVLDQQFDAKRPNDESWVSDITYIWTSEGWLYLAGVKDLYTKKLVGYAINKRMTAI